MPSIMYVSGILFLFRSLPYISILFQDHAQFNGVIIAVEAGMNIPQVLKNETVSEFGSLSRIVSDTLFSTYDRLLSSNHLLFIQFRLRG